ncbi:hypothetical protein HDU76_001195 [Blyttiomyces sp. JEL0837]|nr:hypothetical protein HDU76_001195 [Blyttiomyces sp. JEL0837]
MADGTTTAISDLAGEVDKKDESWVAKLPAVPIAVVVTTVVIIALAAVTGPVGGILGSTSQSTTNDLSSLVMNQAVDITAVQVQDVLDQPYRILQVTSPDLNVKRAMLTNFNNLRNETVMYQWMSNMMNTSAWVNGISCVSYPNGPPGPFGPNTTFIANYKIRDYPNTAMWVDWSTNGFLVESKFNESTGNYMTPDMPYPIPWNYVLLNTELFKSMFTRPTDTTPEYSWTYNQGVMIASVSRSTLDPTISKTHPIYACSIGFETNSALGTLFESIKVTANSKLFMIDSITGTLLANSVPNSIYWVNETDIYKSVTSWTPTTSNDTLLNKIGQTILNMYGNYSRVPYNNGQTVTVQTSIGDGQQWFINTKYLVRPNNWLLVVAIPRNDFFSNIDAAAKKVLIISVTVGVVGVVLVAVASFLALRPLYKLTKAMELLTKMDFSALEGNILKDRSLISEVRKLQVTFSTMCKAFAAGIRKNKTLITGASGGKASSQTASASKP